MKTLGDRYKESLLLLFSLTLVGCGSNVYIALPTASQPEGPPPVATQHGSIFIHPQYEAIRGGQRATFSADASGAERITWLVNGIPGGNSTVGTIDSQGNYAAPANLQQSANAVIEAELTSSPKDDYATAVLSLMAPSVVGGTQNPQVANYSVSLPAPAKITIEFGDSPAYGFSTSAQPCSANLGTCDTLVAGMRGRTVYHMRSHIVFDNGATYVGSDHTFTTGEPPATSKVETTIPANATPQPGIELFDTLRPHEMAQAFATDLAGNVIWTYSYSGSVDDTVQPVTLLANGHFLVQISYPSSIPVQPGGVIPANTLDEVREVDLAGNTIRSVTSTQIASALKTQGDSLEIGSLHHDVLSLPNGHLVLLFSVTKTFNDLPGYPGATKVLGDLLVDVDQNLAPDWVWNSFDHLDVNRHPYLFPDWTHSNAILYSRDDHNLLLSVRHQNWIVKIAFDDGAGSGNIIWRLGEGGDFQLVGAIDPVDWFYAQHGPDFFSTNTSGVFRLGVMDNGDDRLLATGPANCPLNGPPTPSCYSLAEVYEIDEVHMKATELDRYGVHDGPTPGSPFTYSFFGGNVNALADGNMEANFCAAPGGSLVQELSGPYGSQTVVWQAITPGTNQFRAERLPSLYPGVQW